MTFDVFVSIFQGGYSQNNDQGEDNKARRDGRELVKELQNSDSGKESTNY